MNTKLIPKLLGVGTVMLLGMLMTAQALTVSPARAELTADKGEAISESFLLINDQNEDQTFYTSVEAFESQGESGTPNFTASKDGLPSWITVQDKITIKRGERVKVPYTVTVPPSADAGGHFAAIFLSTVPPTAGDGQVSVGAKVGMLVLLKVTGDIKEAGGLLDFKFKEEKKTFNTIPLTFVYRFKNDGNDRVNPEGTITIKNMFGGEIASLDANQTKGNILPGSVRRFEVAYGEDKAPDVAAPFFDHVKYQKKHFAVGMYTATISLAFGNNGKAEQSLTYFMLPWQLLTVLIGGTVIALLALMFLLKRYNQWVIKQARQAGKK